MRLYADHVLVAETEDERVFAAVMNHINGPEQRSAEELRKLGTFMTALRKKRAGGRMSAWPRGTLLMKCYCPG